MISKYLTKHQIAQAQELFGIKLVEHDATSLKIAEIDSGSYYFIISRHNSEYYFPKTDPSNATMLDIHYEGPEGDLETWRYPINKILNLSEGNYIMSVQNKMQLQLLRKIASDGYAHELRDVDVRSKTYLVLKREPLCHNRLKRESTKNG